MIAVVALVLLRLSIGWHFFYQGIWKLRAENFSSEPFLRQAKGPFAARFQALIPDYYGLERLDAEKVVADWQEYLDQFDAHYGPLEEEELAAGEQILTMRRKQLTTYLDSNADDIEEYALEVERYRGARESARLNSVAYERKRLWDQGKQLESKSAAWLAKVDSIGVAFRADLDRLLDGEQVALGGVPRERSRLEQVDALITYSNLAIGICLLIGLFTRFAAISGGLFLLSIVMQQPELPFVYPPAPAAAGRSLLINKEFIEMMALFALAATHVGRWGGLDFFIHYLITRPIFRRRSEA